MLLECIYFANTQVFFGVQLLVVFVSLWYQPFPTVNKTSAILTAVFGDLKNNPDVLWTPNVTPVAQGLLFENNQYQTGGGSSHKLRSSSPPPQFTPTPPPPLPPLVYTRVSTKNIFLRLNPRHVILLSDVLSQATAPPPCQTERHGPKGLGREHFLKSKQSLVQGCRLALAVSTMQLF